MRKNKLLRMTNSKKELVFLNSTHCFISKTKIKIVPGDLITLANETKFKISLVDSGTETPSSKFLSPNEFLLVEKISSTKEKQKTRQIFKIDLLKITDTYCCRQYIVIPQKLLWIFEKI
jgi:hypothetical protein